MPASLMVNSSNARKYKYSWRKCLSLVKIVTRYILRERLMKDTHGTTASSYFGARNDVFDGGTRLAETQPDKLRAPAQPLFDAEDLLRPYGSTERRREAAMAAARAADKIAAAAAAAALATGEKVAPVPRRFNASLGEPAGIDTARLNNGNAEVTAQMLRDDAREWNPERLRQLAIQDGEAARTTATVKALMTSAPSAATESPPPQRAVWPVPARAPTASGDLVRRPTADAGVEHATVG